VIRCLLVCIVGLSTPLFCHRAVADDAAALKTLQDKLKADKPKLAEEIEKRLKQAQERIAQINRGHIVFGRVHVEGDVDPRQVVAQMFILEDGYFIGPTGSTEKPIGFRLNGYENIIVNPKGQGPIEDLGTVEIKKLAPDQLCSATAEVTIEAHPNAPKLTDVTVTWDIRPHPINTPSNGFEGRPPDYQPMTPIIEANGKFSLKGLSPGPYNVTIKAPNCVVSHRSLTIGPGEARNMKPFHLEMIRQMNIEYAVSPDGSFDQAEFKTATLKADDRWRASDATPEWGFDLLIGQKEETLQLETRYGPCNMQDLGKLQLDDELKIDEQEFKNKQPMNVPAKEGHVYIIYHKTWNQWILLRTTEVNELVANKPK
jgi:hypothetical protein